MYIDSTNGDTGIFWTTGTTSGTEIRLEQTKTKRIGPKLYFKYIRSKLKKTEVARLRKTLLPLKQMIEGAEELGQYALQEALAEQILTIVRTSELEACKITQYIFKDDINRFLSIVSEGGRPDSKIVYFKNFEEFPRPVPDNITKHIKSIKEKNLFKELWILYLDYTQDSKTIKSNKEKIREKDPILFGKDSVDENKFWYIIDWVDDICDLSLNEVVSKLGKPLGKTEAIDFKFLERLKNQVLEQKDRLQQTQRLNYKVNMNKEDKLHSLTRVRKFRNFFRKLLKT